MSPCSRLPAAFFLAIEAAGKVAVMRNIEGTLNITAIMNLKWSSESMRISGNPIEPVIRKQAAESARVSGKGRG